MKKEIIRRGFLKLKLVGLSYKECQKWLENNVGIKFSIRILKYWKARFEKGDWNLRDKSQRPHIIHYKFSADDLEHVIKIRTNGGYSAYQIKPKLEEKGISMSESMIKRIIKGTGLSRGNKMEGKRLKWVRFERDTPNSMWQLDGTQKDDGTWILPIEDDCSRYCISIRLFEQMTTKNVIELLEEAIRMH